MTVLIIIVLGLCAGSFINALVWRIHQQQAKQNKAFKSLSILKGRSMCTNCNHTLVWYDLMPVISWVMLGGKCRYCKKVISLQYPLIELLIAGMFLLSYLYWSRPLDIIEGLTLGLWLLILVGLVALLIYDLRWMILPNRILFPIFIPALIYAATNVLTGDNIFLSLFQNILSVLALGGLFWLLFQISQGRWIGGGDVKLGFLLGLIVGLPSHAILLLLLASIMGTLVAVPLLLVHKAQATTKLPFGPFLISSCIIVVLYGTSILSWYQELILVGI